MMYKAPQVPDEAPNSVDPGIVRSGLDELNPVDRFHTVCDGSTRGPVIEFTNHGQPDPEVVR